MFVWLVWAFIFLDFRFLAAPHLVAAARTKERRAQIDAADPVLITNDVAVSGFVGCLYSDVCSPGEECINDKLFGRCISSEERRALGDVEETVVSGDELFLSGLEKLMQNLWLSGFTWHDLLTQCIVRTALSSYKMKAPMDLSVCEPHVLDRGWDSSKRSEEPIHVHKYAPPSLEEFLSAASRNPVAREQQQQPEQEENSEMEVQEMDAPQLGRRYDAEEEDEPAVDTFILVQQPSPLQPFEEDDEQPSGGESTDEEEQQSRPLWEDPMAQVVSDEGEFVTSRDGSEEDRQMEFLNRLLSQRSAPTENMLQEDTGNVQNAPSTDKGNGEGRRKVQEERAKRVLSRRMSHVPHDNDARVVDRSVVSVRVNKAGEKLNDSLAIAFLQELSIRLNSGVNFATQRNVDINKQEITFRVPATSNVSPDRIVERLKNNSNLVPGFTIEDVAYGTPSNYVTITALHPENNDRFVLTLILCSAVLAAVTIVLVIFFIQRHRLSSKKLWTDYSNEATVSSIQPIFYGGGGASTSSGGAEAYRDLCRQHAQSKAMEESMDTFLPEHQGGRRRSEDSTSPRTSTSSWTEEPAQSNMDICTGHAILSYMEEHLNKKDKLEAEWQTMCSYESDGAQTTEARKEANAPKNRYIDALPYDRSRVKLQNSSSSGGDYINASFIVDHDPKVPLYIATQGPLVNTVVDFWQMVWEQNSVVVVNLSCLIEAGVPMCQKYWPEEGSQVFDKFEVHLVSEHVWCEEYLVRSFYLKNLQTNETRTITQFHYIAWPDLDVPSSSRSLLEFRRKVNKSFRNKTSPVIIHCSDGCGRAGTYILLDMILTRLSRGVKEVDVAAALEHIRDQRMDMVKTKEQFEFVLLCIAEEVQSILKVMSS